MTDHSKEVARVGAYATTPLSERQRYALALSEAGELVPKNFWTKPAPAPGGGLIPARPNPGAILYMLEVAAMIGVNPMVGLTNIHIIEGKPSLSANLQAALVREAGHRLRVWMDGTTAVCEIVRSDDPDFAFRVEWGDEQMNAAGLANKDNWRKYQRSMKKARAITECIREACPEVLMGATYSPDELGARTDEMGEPIDLEQVPNHGSMPPNVSRETPAGEPRPETPIVDTRPAEAAAAAEGDGPRDWGKAITDLATYEEAKDLYREARAGGFLDEMVKIGRRKPRRLEEIIIEVGEAFAEAEKAAEQSVQQQDTEEVVHAEVDGGDEGTPAVLAGDDPNIEDAEIIG